jgi:hypothetical protein
MEPKFGSMIDIYGGTSIPEEEVLDRNAFSVSKETSLGNLSIKFVEGGINILNLDLGIGLIYGENGQLKLAGINLSKFCENINPDMSGDIGGEYIADIFSLMNGMGDNYHALFDLENRIFAVLNMNNVTGKQELVSSMENANFSLDTLIQLKYGRSSLFIRYQVIEDELAIGISGGNFEAKPDTNMKASGLRVLTDCNYQTFLDSSSEDKYDNLARRVFLLS